MPVGGFRFVDPDTKFEFNRQYRTFEELSAHVFEYRKQNKLPEIEEFRKVWEHFICHEFGMEKMCCNVDADIERSFEQYLSGARFFVRKIFKGSEFVSQEIAESRAKVCDDCNQNRVNIGHRMGQMYTDAMMGYMTKGKKTSLDNELKTCNICTCLLRPKVHFPSKEVAESLSDAEVGRLTREPKSLKTGRHLQCWQLAAVEEAKGK